MGFTGIPDIDRLILIFADDESLCMATQCSTYLYGITSVDFWKGRIIKYYGWCPEANGTAIPKYKKYYIKFIDKKCKRCGIVVTNNEYGCDFCGVILCDDCDGVDDDYDIIPWSCDTCGQQYCFSVRNYGKDIRRELCYHMTGYRGYEYCSNGDYDHQILPKYKRIFTGRNKPK